MKSIRDLIQHVRASRKGPGRLLEAAAVPGSELLARLPIELHIMLLEYLDQVDIVVALNASKTLRLAWLCEDIWPWLAEKWHPGLSQALQTEAARSLTTTGPRKGKDAARCDKGELFRQRFHRMSTRTTGKYASMLHHSLQLIGDPIFSMSKNVPATAGGIHSIDELDEDMIESLKDPSHVSRFMVYNNGRIAWWPDAWAAPYIAVVDDLRTAQRKVYRFPDHGDIQRGYRTAMSDQLLVIGREKMLHAWHFDKDLLASVVIPESFERCIAEGSRVLIVTRSSEVYLWEFGGSLEPMFLGSVGCYHPGPIRVGGLVEAPLQDRDPPLHIPRRQGLVFKQNDMLLDIIIHPRLGHVFFIVTMHRGQVIVHEISHGTLVQSYALHNGSTSSTEGWNQVNEYLRWEKCDSYGGYRLLSVYLGVSEQLSPADLQRPEDPRCTCGKTEGLVSVCFNIYTKRFKVDCHHFLTEVVVGHAGYLSPVPAAFHLWDNKLYTSYASTSNQASVPVTALRCCLVTQEMLCDSSAGTMPVYTVSESSRGILARRHATFPERKHYFGGLSFNDAARRVQIEFGLDVTAKYAPRSVREHFTNLWKWDEYHTHQTVAGDDDFLVYVVNGVYMVWSFGDEVAIPNDGAARWAPWRRAQPRTG